MTNPDIIDYIKKSFELKNQGFYKPAIEMLYKALAIDPENIEILVQLAHLYKLLDNFQKAIYYIEKTLDIDPKHLDCLTLLEEIYIEQGELNSACKIRSKIYELQPTSENLAKKINILNMLDNYDSILEIESSTDVFDDIILYEFACAHYNNYDKEKAIEALEKAYSKNNKNINAMLLLAKIYYDNNELTKSKKLFLELDKLTKSPETLNYIGLFSLNENKLDEAITYFSKAEKYNPKNAEYPYNIASAYFLKGWLEESIKYFNKAICLDSENINYHYSLAYAYYQKNDYDKAIIELDLIYSLEQHHEPSNVLRAMITAKNGDLLTAKKQLENIIDYNNTDDFALFAIGQVYRELSIIDKAKTAVEKAIELKPDSLIYISELIEIEFSLKNYQHAIELAEEIINVNKNYIYAYVSIAKANYELNQYENLYEIAQEIIELDSNSPEGYFYNAISLFKQGDIDFAIESLKKSISLDLYNATLYAKMSEFYQELGDFSRALDWAKEASDIDERNYKYKWLCAKLAATTHNESDAAKYYSQSHILAPGDKDLSNDYSNYLKSIGKNKQAEKIIK